MGVPVCTYGVHSLGHLLMFSKEKPDAAPTTVVASIKKNLVHSSNDVKLAALETMKHLSKTTPEVINMELLTEVIAEFTLAFVLQLHKNDVLYDECMATMMDSSNFLQEYRNVSFEKLSDTVAADNDDYKFVT